MSNSNNFIRSWYMWQRADAPVSNFRLRRANIPTYALEHDLDHLVSYVYALGERIIGKQPISVEAIKEGIKDLEAISLTLQNCNIENETKAEYENYISKTHDLLNEMLKISSPSSSESLD